MADMDFMNNTLIQKNSKILVNVDESLPDILVVTYEYGSKIFQGVLLDSTKRNLPYGVSSLHPAYSNDKPDAEDRLYSANQRFTYQEGPSSKEFTQKRPVRLPARYKNSKMTVRLRPRQVLCSKCRGICNENSENVDASKKRKATDEQTTDNKQKRLAVVATRNSRPLSSDSQSNEQFYQQQRMCLRLAPSNGDSSGETTNADLDEEDDATNSNFKQNSLAVSQAGRKDGGGTRKAVKKRMVLRKKRSVGSMEDLWDESVFEENAKNAAKAEGIQENSQGNTQGSVHNTRTIKISFGRGGEGTVLKIPANIEGLHTSTTKDEDDCENDADTEHVPHPKVRAKDAKAARRALKKAKKEARRKILLGSGGSPCYPLGTTSPRYTFSGAASSRCAASSPRHQQVVTTPSPSSPSQESPVIITTTIITSNINNNNNNSTSTSTTTTLVSSTNCNLNASSETLVTRRHKHKVKHKKKHREDKERHGGAAHSTTGIVSLATSLGGGTSIASSYESVDMSDMKERCLKQKLSINLKRLNASAYTTSLDAPPALMSTSPEPPNATSVIVSAPPLSPELPTPSADTVIVGDASNLTGIDSDENGSDEQTPDFPVHADGNQQPLMVRLTAHAVRESLGADGRKLGVGDVVWGKIHGFPWWPGKVLSIQQIGQGCGSSAQAHVAWYGSSTSSVMPCSQLSPFLENFKIRYNKKKRGPYKEAIKQATCEARTELPRSPPLAAMSPLARPTLASPREIDVVS